MAGGLHGPERSSSLGAATARSNRALFADWLREAVYFVGDTYDTVNPLKCAIGARFSAARIRAGYTQAEASKLLGYSQAVQLSNWENGGRMPTVSALVACSVLYGVSASYLLCVAEYAQHDEVEGVRADAERDAAECAAALQTALVDELASVVRQLSPIWAAVRELAAQAQQAGQEVTQLRSQCPAFDEVPGGAPVLAKAERAAGLASQYIQQLAGLRVSEQAYRSKAAAAPGNR